MRELGVAAHLDRAHHQPPGHHHRARGDQVALGDVGRDGLPGHHAGVHRGLPELCLPVSGDPFPGAHDEPLAFTQLRDRNPVLGPVSVQDARVPGAGRGQLPHRVPGVAPCLGLIEAASQQERRHRRGDLQVDPAPGCVQQQVGEAQPALAAVQDEHRIHRPAARRGDAQRHQRVHRRPSRAGRSAARRRGTATPTTPPPVPPPRSGPTASPGTATTGTATAAPTGQSAGRTAPAPRPAAGAGRQPRPRRHHAPLAAAGRQQTPRPRRDRESQRGNRPARPRR